MRAHQTERTLRTRIRTIKPELFTHEALFDAEESSGLPLRLAFAGLFTCCCREGRFPWRPRTLKSQVMPFDAVDFCEVLDALSHFQFVVRYEVNGEAFGVIPAFRQHQQINSREAKSEYPAPPWEAESGDACGTGHGNCSDASRDATRDRSDDQPRGEGKGREGKGTPTDASATRPGGDLLDLLNALARSLDKRRPWTNNEERDALDAMQTHGLARCLEVAGGMQLAQYPVAMLRARLNREPVATKPPAEMDREEWEAFSKARRKAMQR